MKELWRKNKVLIVLGIVLLTCLITIICVSITYFMKGNKDKRENTYTIENSYLEEYKNSFLSDESVDKVSINVKVKTLSIIVYFKENTKLDDAKKVIEKMLGELEKDIVDNYDISYMITSTGENNFTIIGSKNMTSNNIEWNNNTPIVKEENTGDNNEEK